MKKLYFLLLLSLLSPAHLYAQATDSMRLKLDYFFANIDKSQVPTGFLDAYATPLIPLASFNGTLADSTRTTPSVFRALYATAYSSCIYGTNPLQTLQSFNASATSAEAELGPNVIPIMVARFDYATVRQEAFSQSLLTIQNQRLYDVAGRTSSPYSTRTMFAASPTRPFARTGNVALQFQSSLFTEVNASAGFNLLSLFIDLGDGGGYVAANWDEPIQANYTTSGNKRVKVRFTYFKPGFTRNGRVTPAEYMYYNSQFDLLIAAPSTGIARTTADSFKQFDALPGQAAGTAYVHYGTDHITHITHTSLVKPFIVAEGYDRSSVAPHTAMNYSIEQFLDEINVPNGFNLSNALSNVGDYDIVFIDYANGTDDILLNAGLFKAVVDWVNTTKDRTANQKTS
jgi:hypothetical protein